jgi:Restriction endonuclease
LHAGVEFLWLVECKWWDRRVPKAAVVTLSGIMLDVGADRGIILSRRGFQSGAPAMARKSNITLTSLDELKAGTCRLRSKSEQVSPGRKVSTLQRLAGARRGSGNYRAV